MTRKESKKQTRNKIFEHATKLIQEQGVQDVSTKNIAKCAQVSQGSIFLHFKTKNLLISTVFISYIDLFEKDFNERFSGVLTIDQVLKNLISVFQKYENILSRIYKDIDYISKEVVERLELVESNQKNTIFDNIRRESKKLSIVDTFVAIDAFYAQTKIYLMEKEIYNSTNSIIRLKRGRIIKLFNILFQ